MASSEIKTHINIRERKIFRVLGFIFFALDRAPPAWLVKVWFKVDIRIEGKAVFL